MSKLDIYIDIASTCCVLDVCDPGEWNRERTESSMCFWVYKHAYTVQNTEKKIVACIRVIYGMSAFVTDVLW